MRKLKDYTPTQFMAEDSHYDKAAADYPGVIKNPERVREAWQRAYGRLKAELFIVEISCDVKMSCALC